jgi:hypothetical protein
MSSQSYAPYRGYCILVHVTPVRAFSIGGIARRYRVSWGCADGYQQFAWL